MKSLNKNPELPPKLKRFLTFGALNTLTLGGWDDFLGDFDSKEEALLNINEYILGQIWKESLELKENNIWEVSWAQIFDTETQKIVWTEQDN